LLTPLDHTDLWISNQTQIPDYFRSQKWIPDQIISTHVRDGIVERSGGLEERHYRAL